MNLFINFLTPEGRIILVQYFTGTITVITYSTVLYLRCTGMITQILLLYSIGIILSESKFDKYPRTTY
jgi:hypothetical protein